MIYDAIWFLNSVLFVYKNEQYLLSVKEIINVSSYAKVLRTDNGFCVFESYGKQLTILGTYKEIQSNKGE